jgi:hypothetical protein
MLRPQQRQLLWRLRWWVRRRKAWVVAVAVAVAAEMGLCCHNSSRCNPTRQVQHLEQDRELPCREAHMTKRDGSSSSSSSSWWVGRPVSAHPWMCTIPAR